MAQIFDYDERNEHGSDLMQAWAKYQAEQELSEVAEEEEQKKEFDEREENQSFLELEREEFNSDEYAFDTDLLNEF